MKKVKLKGDLLARWMPSVLCIAIALTQMVLARTQNLSPWLGGGFGMFSGLDSPMNRVLICEAIDENGIPLTVSIKSSKLLKERFSYFKLLTFPSQSELNRLASLLLDAELLLEKNDLPSSVKSPEGNLKSIFKDKQEAIPPLYRVRLANEHEADSTAIRLQAVRISVWRLWFETDDARLTRTIIGKPVEVGKWR